MHPMLTTAVKAARRAGAVISRASFDLDAINVSRKRHNDFVSDVDRAAESEIIRVLRDAYPSHAILAEESGTSGESEYQWVIDPLDGTTNFLHGFPQYAVSIALVHRGIVTQAVVFDPTRNDLFTATRGAGAFLNDRRIRVSARSVLHDCLIGTGFPYHEFEHLDTYMGMFREFLTKTAGVRRPGSAALDLAYVAAGRLDGFWEIGLNPWDIAAGTLLVSEAGGLVGDFQGEANYLKSGHIVAANPKVFALMLKSLSPHLTAALR